jgi:hypothetical protein
MFPLISLCSFQLLEIFLNETFLKYIIDKLPEELTNKDIWKCFYP